MYRIPVAILLFVLSAELSAAALTVTVLDNAGQPVPGAVVEFKHPDITGDAADSRAVMDQVDKQFKPRILVVQQGSLVGFPNSDSIKHHVYSFSAAKRFQLRLYKDREPDPLLFDKAGVVALGCNIHDWMSGYIYVAQSGLYGRTDDSGQLSINAPSLEYSMSVWHPRFKDRDQNRVITVNADTDKALTFQLEAGMHPELDSSADEFDVY